MSIQFACIQELATKIGLDLLRAGIHARRTARQSTVETESLKLQ